MICSKCGKEVFEGVKYCPNCANPILDNIYAQQTINGLNNLSNSGQVMHTDLNQNMSYPQQSNSSNKVMNNKKNNSWIYILCFIGLMLVICGIIIAFTDDPKADVTSNKDNTSNITSNSSSNKNNDNTIKTINFKGYIFSIPANYITSISNKNQLQVLSSDKSEIYVYDIQQGSYDSLKKNQSYIRTEFEKQGYKVGSILVRTYEGIEFITVEVLNNEIDMILAYSKLSSTQTYMVAAGNSSYKIDYNLMNNVARVLKNVTRA